jgi:hypothetical protein
MPPAERRQRPASIPGNRPDRRHPELLLIADALPTASRAVRRNGWLVHRGRAVAYWRYSRRYALPEIRARIEGAGLCQGISSARRTGDAATGDNRLPRASAAVFPVERAAGRSCRYRREALSGPENAPMRSAMGPQDARRRINDPFFWLKSLKKMARPRGVEPLTPRSVVWCSIQLSYGRINRSALSRSSASLAVISAGYPLRAGAHT